MKNFHHHKFSQSGLTLIEILIAVVIGLILIAGTMQIYLSNQQSSRSQDAMAYMNNNARYAFNLLQNTVSLAGFRADPSTTNADAFPSVSAPRPLQSKM